MAQRGSAAPAQAAGAEAVPVSAAPDVVARFIRVTTGTDIAHIIDRERQVGARARDSHGGRRG
jgi:hypothetical protein